MDALKQLKATHPHLNILSPSTPDYDAARKVYDTSNKEEPLGIVAPKNAEEVAQLVKFATENKIDFSLRAGGHDPLGRAVVSKALLIDLRPLDSITLDEAAQTVTVGGGVITSSLLRKLQEKGFVVPAGSIPWVGYVGWCTMGGYGLFSGSFGLGVDSILAAKVVTASGEIIAADEELLKGIRGAGGNFGVIVEMTVKAYRLDKIFSGTIIFDGSNITDAFKQFAANLSALTAKESLPSALEIHPLVINTPMGRTFAVLFAWSSPDLTTGRAWLDKITSLGSLIHADVQETTIADSCEGAAKVVAPFTLGAGSIGLNLRDLTPQAAEVIGKHLARMPSDIGNGLSIHQLKGSSTKDTGASVFGAREPHYMVEFIATVVDESLFEETKKWAEDFYAELTEKASSDIMESSWVPLTPTEKTDLKKIYGQHYDTVMALKKKFDPDNVFKNALPRISPSS